MAVAVMILVGFLLSFGLRRQIDPFKLYFSPLKDGWHPSQKIYMIASREAGKHTIKQSSKQASKQATNQAMKQATKQASKRAST